MPTLKVASDDTARLQDVADTLAYSKKIVIVTGAGISTNTGIPDFRSENGLYSLIQNEYNSFSSTQNTLDSSQESVEFNRSSGRSSQSSESQTTNAPPPIPSNVKGKDLFDSRIWSDERSTSVFYRFIASLRKRVREVSETTPTHKFIQSLRNSGRLVRCYTQNIDGLESRDGLCTNIRRGKGNRARMSKKVVMQQRPEHEPVEGSEMDGGCEVVQLHGDLQDLRCGFCQAIFSWDDEDWNQIFLEGEAPTCPKCAGNDEARQKRGRRSIGIGFLRPNVVLYGEQHPASHLISEITEHDLSLAPDTLIIMGTSLKVHGLKVLIREFAKAVRCRRDGSGKVIFVNLSKPSESVWGDVIDYWVDMDCDQWVEDLRARRSDIWTRQGDPRPKRKKKRKIRDQTNISSSKGLCNAAGAVMEAAQILLLLSSGLAPALPHLEGIRKQSTPFGQRARSPQKRKRPSNDVSDSAIIEDKAIKKCKRKLVSSSETSNVTSDIFHDHSRPPGSRANTFMPSTPTVWKNAELRLGTGDCELHMPVPTPPSSARSSIAAFSPGGIFDYDAYPMGSNWPDSFGCAPKPTNQQPNFPSKIVEELERSCSQSTGAVDVCDDASSEERDRPVQPVSRGLLSRLLPPLQFPSKGFLSASLPSIFDAGEITSVSESLDLDQEAPDKQVRWEANGRSEPLPFQAHTLTRKSPAKLRIPEVEVLCDEMTYVKSENHPRGSFLDVVLGERINGRSIKRVRKPSRKLAAEMDFFGEELPCK